MSKSTKSKKIVSKNDIIALIAAANDISKAEAGRFFESFFTVIESELAHNHKIVLNGIMSLTKSRRKERNGRNPQTGTQIKIPAKDFIAVKVSPAFGVSK